MRFFVCLSYAKGRENRLIFAFFNLFGKVGIKRQRYAHTFDMIKPTKNISDVKQMVKECSAQRIFVRVNLGRNKSVSYSGILSGIYPALFTVKPDDDDFLGKTAYSYSDVLCGAVKLKKLP